MPHGHFTKPTSASGYLEAMTRIIMTAGINWHVVDAKWEGIRKPSPTSTSTRSPI